MTSLSDLLNKVIPHFLLYPLQGSKGLIFQDFAEAVKLMIEGAHLTANGLAELQEVVANRNKKRHFADKYNHLATNTPIVNADYIRGFVDGEGHFIEINSPSAGRSVPTIACSLQVAQASHDVILLNAIRNYFYSKPIFDIFSLDITQEVRNVVRLWVTQVVTTTRLGTL